MNRISPLLLAIFLISCGSSDRKTSKQDTVSKETFEPKGGKLYTVPAELVEISGISFVSDSVLVAVQDEEGILFFYDLNKEAITRQYEFWKGKDYEDLAVVGNDLWIVNSSGALYELKNFNNGPSKPNVFKTVLKEENNIEGLALDKKNNRLLLAVKDLSMDGDEKEKDIYAFDLKTKTLNIQPVFSIRLSEIETFFKGDEIEEVSKKILKAVGNQNLNKVFRTSALAFHPKTGELYVLSSLNNIVAVLDQKGSITKVLELDGKEFIQPEGLAFTQDGRLFVSNEGQGKQANIIELKYED
ncbi:SdiA-regulated domain-containing protein [Paradesertivirga mongoliensis]|uniref:SdiA-regulated domain-containing protein n=1 Tax=Paradesertivirga mongoliensis TaxID=2100740 RepID=A0ABW4ZG24_9SPHI|nr:SdiA-regulated domain-containing protein [Pedobacter mongoliensis]